MTLAAMDTSFDAAKSRAFAERLLGALNDGALCLMISIGRRTGLFDACAACRLGRAPRSRRPRRSTSATCESGWARW